MTSKKIDIHKVAQRYAQALTRLQNDTTICAVNRQIMLDFLNACQLGKTVFGREKKRLGEKRLLKYVYTLRRINEWLGNRDYRTIDQVAMETFICTLERNALIVAGKSVTYTEWTRRDIKVCVKKFYKWLLGDSRQYPDLVAWIDTHIRDEAPPCLTLDEVHRCVEFASTIRNKALMLTLFETGARAEELLNVRLADIEDKRTHIVLRIEHSKTYRRCLPVYEAAVDLRLWLKEHPSRCDGEAQLFPMSYASLRKLVARLGQKALGKSVTPHLLRHSFATWLASKKVGRYQMCKLMGWAMSSDMPDRYIDRVGVVEEEAIQSIRGDELSKVEHENQLLKATLQRLEAQQQLQQEQLGRYGCSDDLLQALLADENLVNALAKKVRAKGLGKDLMEMR